MTENSTPQDNETFGWRRQFLSRFHSHIERFAEVLGTDPKIYEDFQTVAIFNLQNLELAIETDPKGIEEDAWPVKSGEHIPRKRI